MKTQRAGLTLVEAVVVIGTIVLVPAVITSALVTARQLAEVAMCANQMKRLHVALQDYCTDANGFLPNVYTNSGKEEVHPHALWRGDKKGEYWDPVAKKWIPLRYACVYEAGYLPDPRILYCPANKNPVYTYAFYANPEPWGSLPQENNYPPPRGKGNGNQWVRMGYTYYPTDPNDPKSPITGAPSHTARKFEKIDPDIPYLADNFYSRPTISHDINEVPGVNALFKDGHVVYCDDDEVFNNEYWDWWENHYIDAWGFYYNILRLVGETCGPGE